MDLRITDPDTLYALAVCGGGAVFFVAWWIFCLVVRLGIDGVKAASRAINEKRWPDVRKILIGTWR
jgi:hypothetical protein